MAKLVQHSKINVINDSQYQKSKEGSLYDHINSNRKKIHLSISTMYMITLRKLGKKITQLDKNLTKSQQLT